MNNVLNPQRLDYYENELSKLCDLVLNLRLELVKEISLLDTSENDRFIYLDSINSLTAAIRELENCEYSMNKV